MLWICWKKIEKNTKQPGSLCAVVKRVSVKAIVLKSYIGVPPRDISLTALQLCPRKRPESRPRISAVGHPPGDSVISAIMPGKNSVGRRIEAISYSAPGVLPLIAERATRRKRSERTYHGRGRRGRERLVLNRDTSNHRILGVQPGDYE